MPILDESEIDQYTRPDGVTVIRRAAKQDRNAKELVAHARDIHGMDVIYINEPVDLLVGHKGKWTPTEIKFEDGPFTAQQIEFMGQCNRANLPYWVWRTTDDIDAVA